MDKLKNKCDQAVISPKNKQERISDFFSVKEIWIYQMMVICVVFTTKNVLLLGMCCLLVMYFTITHAH